MEIYKEFLNKLKSIEKKDEAIIVFLCGDLGSGKTTFTKRLCEYLNFDIEITSPTFTILKKYNFELMNFKHLIHIDAYRLKSYEDLIKLKFNEYLKEKSNLIFIEWPSLVENKNLRPDIVMEFDYVDDVDQRSIKIL